MRPGPRKRIMQGHQGMLRPTGAHNVLVCCPNSAEDGFGSCNSLTIAPVPEGASILPAVAAWLGKCSCKLCQATLYQRDSRWSLLTKLLPQPVTRTSLCANSAAWMPCNSLEIIAWAATLGVLETDRVRNECPHEAQAGERLRVARIFRSTR